MDNVYNSLRKPHTIAMSDPDEKLSGFLRQFYEITDIDGIIEPENTLYYAEVFEADEVKNIKCGYIWSASSIAPEVMAFMPEGAIVVEHRDIKNEYIVRFLGNCSI